RSRTGSVHMFNAAMLSAAVDSSPFGRPVPAAGGVEAIRLLGELRQALERRELVLVYQPKFDLRTSAIVGVEALIRWPHPGRGLLMPDLFL
ncbi:MAG: EAL domain-containing protein, partial [Mycobacterium sp.]|nr:EAL domain-containing protein [Mycobacterium sp.]